MSGYYSSLYEKRRRERELKQLVSTLTDEEKQSPEFIEIVDFVERLREKKRLENLKYKKSTASSQKRVEINAELRQHNYSEIYASVKTLPALSDSAFYRLQQMQQQQLQQQQPEPWSEEMEKYEFDIFALHL